MRGGFFLALLLFLISVGVCASDTLVFTVLVTRHGDRTPFKRIKNADYKWDAGVAELTPIGMNEEYQLGKKLREHYINGLKFLEPSYKSNSIFAVSSDSNRTIQSAECLLTGLYPPGTGPILPNGKSALPKRIQPIPVRVLPKDFGLILTPYPTYINILKKYVYGSDAWKTKEKDLNLQFKKWTKILGNKIEGLDDIIIVGDVLIVAKQHDKPLPKGLTEEDANQLITLNKWAFAQEFKSPQASYLCGGRLLNAITENMKDAISGNKPYKMVYYSGHDITILPLFSLLGKPLDKSPGYAAYILFELYKNDKNSYTLKVKYDGEYIKFPLMKGHNFCDIESYFKYVKSVNLKYKNLSH